MQHLKQDHKKSYQCKKCDQILDDYEKLIKHLKQNHSSLKCKFCLQHISSYGQIKSHNKKCHKYLQLANSTNKIVSENLEETYMCCICTFILPSKDLLEEHMLEHQILLSHPVQGSLLE
ncbi:Zinc_finger C2H2-type [Hexamita inflata]|nr:Zinc finger C2H2-type [Hexamita inflata]